MDSGSGAPTVQSTSTPGPGSEILQQLMQAAKAEAQPITSDEEIAKRVKFLTDYQATTFRQSAAHLQLVQVAGYAALFALWKFAQPSLSDFASNILVLSIGFSLSVFLAFSIFGMVWFTVQTRTIKVAIQGKTGADYLNAFTSAQTANDRRLEAVFWPVWEKQIICTVCPAAFAFFILIINAARALLTAP